VAPWLGCSVADASIEASLDAVIRLGEGWAEKLAPTAGARRHDERTRLHRPRVGRQRGQRQLLVPRENSHIRDQVHIRIRSTPVNTQFGESNVGATLFIQVSRLTMSAAVQASLVLMF